MSGLHSPPQQPSPFPMQFELARLGCIPSPLLPLTPSPPPMHMQEAALYVQEGEDDAKFYQHPDSRWSKIAYSTLHHYTYRILHLAICVLLLVLAFAESPAVGQDKLTSEDKKVLVSVSCCANNLLVKPNVGPLFRSTVFWSSSFCRCSPEMWCSSGCG